MEVSKGEEQLTRRNDLDWLRVLAILTIFLYHTSMFFNYSNWHVKNMDMSLGISVFSEFLEQWIMPLIFMVSGASTYFALSFRKPGKYIKERVARLVVPLIFGIFVLSPPQVFFERVSHNQFHDTFANFLPHYFDGLYGFGGNFGWMGLHLWYLLILFIFSVITLPLFFICKRIIIERPISRWTNFLVKPGVIFLLAIPLCLLEILLNPGDIGRRDFGGWSLFLYLIFYFYGYFILSNHRVNSVIEKNRIITLVGGVVLSIIMIVKLLPQGWPAYGSLDFVILTILRGFNTWLWLMTIIGFGSKYLNSRPKFLDYANEAVLPFYVLHQPIIVSLGFYMRQWQIGIGPKFVALVTVSLTIILVLYFIIKQFNVSRTIFGMRLIKKKSIE